MVEYEWWEDRIKPAYTYIEKHPKSLINLFADAGHGHLDYSDMLVEYVANYIEYAAKYRLSSVSKLKTITPDSGWLMGKWTVDKQPDFNGTCYKAFKGGRKTASWVFNKKKAKGTEIYYVEAHGKPIKILNFYKKRRL